MKKDKYSDTSYSQVLKYLQESRKRIYFVAALLGATLTLVPIVTMAHPSFVYTESGFGKAVNAVNNANSTTFVGNATKVTNGTATFNYVGMGGNDTFDLYGGNATMRFVATGFMNNTFNIVTGVTPQGNTSIWSLVSGNGSMFYIIEDSNFNGTMEFAITAGPNSNVTETSTSFLAGGLDVVNGTTLWSINMGFNSTVVLGSEFEANATVVNVVF